MGATNFEDFDFSQIKAHLDRMREIRLGRSTEEKKKEVQEKLLKDKGFKFCLYDGNLEKGKFWGRFTQSDASKYSG